MCSYSVCSRQPYGNVSCDLAVHACRQIATAFCRRAGYITFALVSDGGDVRKAERPTQTTAKCKTAHHADSHSADENERAV
jgi:hypothetical protein